MRGNDAVRVGLVTLAACLLVGLATFVLPRQLGQAGTYTHRVAFDNAQGLQAGDAVRVQGVDMGAVDQVAFEDGKPRVTLRIKKPDNGGYEVVEKDRVKIVAGLLGFSRPYVEIVPGGAARPGATSATGESSPSPEELMTNANRLVTDLSRFTNSMEKLTKNLEGLTDPEIQRSFKRTVANFEQVSGSGVVIGRNMEATTAEASRLVRSFRASAAGLDRTLRRADVLMASLQGVSRDTGAMIGEARAVVRQTGGVMKGTGELVESANMTIKNAGALVTDTRMGLVDTRRKLNELLDTLTASSKKLDTALGSAQSLLGDSDLRNDLKATGRNVRRAMVNLRKISEDVRKITGDQKVQEDLKVTIGNLRNTTDRASALFDRVERFLGGGGSTARTIGDRFADTELNVSLLRGTRSRQTRLDLDATIPWSRDTFYRVGLYDFGEGNKLNAQLGDRLRGSVWGRYGIHASTLGAGLDFGAPSRPFASVDLYGVDRPRLDVYGRVPISKILDLTLGLDDVTGRADPVFGVRYRR